MKFYQFSLLSLIAIVTCVCIVTTQTMNIATILKANDYFRPMKTYRQVQIERYERARNAKP